MDKQEYDKIKNYTYLEYCDYLQEKYGIGLCDYMTKSWNKNSKCTRTKEGLLAHHKMEDHAIMLSEKTYAMKNPFEWQTAKNIVYCDYLEHLLLHILICEFPAKDKNPDEEVGIGGVLNYLVPELNDMYSGWKTQQAWRKACHERVIKDKEVYLELLERFHRFHKKNKTPFYSRGCLRCSASKRFNTNDWLPCFNNKLYTEIYQRCK